MGSIIPWKLDGNVVMLTFFSETPYIVRLAPDTILLQLSMIVDSESISLFNCQLLLTSQTSQMASLMYFPVHALE